MNRKPSTIDPLNVLAVTTIGLLFFSGKGFSQEAFDLNKSEIVRITDADKIFFETVDSIRADFEKIAEATPAFLAAETAAKKLAGDPKNNLLKAALIDARSKVLEEKSIGLRNIIAKAERLDKNFHDMSKQMEGQIADAQAAIDDEIAAEEGEADFLTKALEQLIKLEKHLPNADQQLAFINVTQREKEDLIEFKKALEVAELQMDLAKDGVTLQQRRMVVLAQIRLEATEEYMALRLAMASARADQSTFAAIAKNDLTSLGVIADEERLAKLIERPKIKYQSPAESSGLRGGYSFVDLPSKVRTEETTLKSNRSIIERFEKRLLERQQQRTAEKEDEKSSTPINTFSQRKE